MKLKFLKRVFKRKNRRIFAIKNIFSDKNLLFLFNTCGLILLLYLFFVALFQRTVVITNYPSYVFIILLGVFIFFTVIARKYFTYIFVNYKNTFVFMFCVGLMLRILYYFIVKPLPHSDFLFYHQYATNISKGIFNPLDKTCLIFPHRVGFSLILGLMYFLIGSSVEKGSLINILFSMINLLLVYVLASKMYDKCTAQVVSILYALWPAQIMYSSVIASENLFMTFFLAAVLLFIKSIENTSSKNIIFSLLCGIFMALAQIIRPVAQMLILVLFVSGIVMIERSKIVSLIKMYLLLILSFILAIVVMNSVIKALTGVPLRWSMGYNFMVGTNLDSHGVYNNKDALILGKYNYDFEKVHNESFKIAIERIKSHPRKFLKLIEEKMAILWGDETYSVNWSFSQGVNLRLSRNSSIKEFLIIFVQVFYLMLLFFTIFGLLLSLKKGSIIISVLIFLIHFVSYFLLEVQSRYHYPAIIFLLPIAAYGIRNFKLEYLKRPFYNVFKGVEG